jgi:hypothetical protein
VVVGIARRDVVDRYYAAFAEAGIRVASFTFSAAAIYSAARLLQVPPAGFLALQPAGGKVEAYGESETRPVFSAAFFNGDERRARTLAVSELRLPPDTEALTLVDILPFPKKAPREDEEYVSALSARALPYAAALSGACPRLSLDANLLPPDRRSAPSRLLWIPTIVLLVCLAALVIVWVMQSAYQDRRYVESVRKEIAKMEPRASRVAALDRSIENVRARTRLLDEFRRRSKSDMDALNELTQILAPPVWVNHLEITRDFIGIAGEADQAALLLKVIDGSKLFENSEFTMPLARSGSNEVFRVRALREGAAR